VYSRHRISKNNIGLTCDQSITCWTASLSQCYYTSHLLWRSMEFYKVSKWNIHKYSFIQKILIYSLTFSLTWMISQTGTIFLAVTNELILLKINDQLEPESNSNLKVIWSSTTHIIYIYIFHSYSAIWIDEVSLALIF
jgi:hypothetical protein